jgi:hypothetical protein
VVSGTDTDAQAFITAAGITNTTQQSAINTLVTQLKTYGIWTKMKALYPFVGGSATSHKFNLKDPRDLDAAYRLTFSGGWTHTSTGAQPNGTTGYADTKLIPSTTLTQYNSHLSYYSRSQTLSSLNIEFGAYVNDNQCMFLTLQRSGGNGGAVQYSISADSNMALLLGNTTTTGMYLSNRNSSTASSLKYIRNGVLLANATTTAGSLPNIPLFLGASNNTSSAFYFSTKQCAFSSIGDGLTDTEAANFYTAVQIYQTTLGRQVGVPIVADADAQAFLNAAVITDVTQASAVNTLVTDLKSANIWTKMKALYPMVGGTATTHKFNLKDPRDLDAAYRLVFNGGWVHSSTGALPNGTTGYANTFFNPFNNLSIDNTHMSYYSRTNNARDSYDMGVTITNTNPLRSLHTVLKWGIDGNTYWSMGFQNLTSLSSEVDLFLPSSAVNFLFNKTSSTSTSLFANNTKYTASVTNRGLPNGNLYLGARNLNGFADLFANRQSAFASIGDGLTDAEAAAFYTAIQTFQTTLGRQIGAPIVSDTDAQAFLNAAVITDVTQANAVNTLVTDLKSANIWSKMKALYPFVGGTATTHKFNLKDPRDLDVAYRLVFNGGWVHSTSGAQPNGTTGYADTKLIPSSTLNLNSTHLSVYLNTNYSSPGSTDVVDMGVEDASYTNRLFIEPSSSGNVYSTNNSNGNSYINTSDSNSLGLYVNNRISSTAINLFKNNIKLINDTARTSSALSVRPLYIGAHNFVGSASYLSPRRQVFASIGDGLTDGEAAAFYTAVQKYQTTLGRAV